jgi:murein DD-endopeptidase MepM/ murein hydrolase activator NlpD
MNSVMSFFSSQQIYPILGKSLPFQTWAKLDLSIENPIMLERSFHDTAGFEKIIFDMMEEKNAVVGWGGYLENRGWYQRAEHFGASDDARTIHLGIDLWAKGLTPLFAPIDGVVHSVKDNALYGDYGPTIILEHVDPNNNSKFYTLYGHLSKDSIEDKKVGESVKQGTQFAKIGTPPTNGDWPPHLHFQVIKDMEGMMGDYPGVSSKSKLHWYSQNCPDPISLLI